MARKKKNSQIDFADQKLQKELARIKAKEQELSEVKAKYHELQEETFNQSARQLWQTIITNWHLQSQADVDRWLDKVKRVMPPAPTDMPAGTVATNPTANSKQPKD